MLEFIQNPWVIGIVGGIVCGIIVWLLTRCAISSKGNNEYIKKIYQANDEVFLSLKAKKHILPRCKKPKNLVFKRVSSNLRGFKVSLKMGVFETITTK